MLATTLGGSWTNSTSSLKSKSTPVGGNALVTADRARGALGIPPGQFDLLTMPLEVLAVV